jgi:putative ABC transport system permease protein
MLKMLRRKTLNDLSQGWKQFLAVLMVVLFGTTFYGAMYPSGINLLSSIHNTYAQLSYMDYQVQMESVPGQVVPAIQGIPEVGAVEGRLVVEAGLKLDPERDALTQLRLISLPDDRPARVNIVDIPEGRKIENDGEILLLKRFADRYGIRPGDSLSVWVGGRQYDLTVAGLAFSAEYLVAGRSREMPFPTISSFGVAWVHYSRLAEMSEQYNRINDLVLTLRVPSEALEQDGSLRNALASAVREYDENPVILSRTQTASGGIIEANANGNLPTVAAFSALFLSGAILVTGVLLGRLVQSERQRIGTLRALGVTRRELALHYLSFGLLIGVAGAGLGSVLGYFASFLTMQPFITVLAGGYLPGFVNSPQIPFILIGALLVAVGATAAGAWSAWKESGTPPGIALRPPTPKDPSGFSRLPLKFLPLPVRQTVRNLLRVPGRSIGTALGVMSGALMIFSSLALLNSMDANFEDYYASGQYDLRLLLDTMLPGEAVERRVRNTPGVQAAQGALIGPVTVKVSGQDDFDTMAIVLDDEQPLIRLNTFQGEPFFSREDGVWIGHNLRRVLNLEVGDTIRLRAGDQEREVRVLGVVSQVFGSPVFVPRSLMAQWLPGNLFVVNTVMVQTEPAERSAVHDELAKLQFVTAVEDYPQFVTDLRNYVEYWRQNVMLFFFFGCLLTLVVILNTVSASLHEQKNELAILRALGTTRSEIALVVALELVIMVALGAALGVPAGREFGFSLLQAYDTDFYGVMPFMNANSYWVGILGMVVAALVAAIPGLRAIYKTDLGAVSKSQSF